jgi:hypothetical protein
LISISSISKRSVAFGGIGAAGAALAVRELGRADELGLAADLHPLHALRPARDDAVERETSPARCACTSCRTRCRSSACRGSGTFTASVAVGLAPVPSRTDLYVRPGLGVGAARAAEACACATEGRAIATAAPATEGPRKPGHDVMTAAEVSEGRGTSIHGRILPSSKVASAAVKRLLSLTSNGRGP